MLLVLVLVLAAGCGGGAGDPSEREALSKLNQNEGYREVVRKDHEEEWAGLSDVEAYSNAEEIGLHPGFLAFVQIYPDSPLAKKAEDRLNNGFRAMIAEEAQVITADKMKDMCWGSKGQMFRWSKRVAGGMQMRGGGAMQFGALAFDTEDGLIQLVTGGYRHVSSGVEVTAGTSFIYPAKCR